MSEKIFRKKSIDRVSSPEQLNEYIRVTNPGVWIVLVAVVILLVGVCAWGVLGRLDTKLTTVAVAENSQTIVYVKQTDIGSIKEGMKTIIDGKEYEVVSVPDQPIRVDSSFSEYTLHVGNLQNGEWVYAVTVSGEATDGTYEAAIITESIAPISFIVN